jgi:hypothetical protein
MPRQATPCTAIHDLALDGALIGGEEDKPAVKI